MPLTAPYKLSNLHYITLHYIGYSSFTKVYITAHLPKFWLTDVSARMIWKVVRFKHGIWGESTSAGSRGTVSVKIRVDNIHSIQEVICSVRHNRHIGPGTGTFWSYLK